MDDRAEKLLEAHVAHELSRLQGEPLKALIDARLVDAFEWLSDLSLADAIAVDDVVGIAERYALQLRLGGGISELAGGIARLVVTSSQSAKTRVRDVVSSESFEEFSEKITSLDTARGELISLVARSEALSVVTARVMAHVLTDLLRRAGARAAVGPAERVFATLQRDVLPELERRAGALLGQKLGDHREFFARHLERHLRDVLSGDALQELAEELWLHVSRMRLSEAFALVGEQDLEDFVVMSFEFWLRLRKTPYMKHILESSVRFFFDKYGDESVAGVIADMGVTRDMVARELQLVLAPLADEAIRSGFLERQLRLHLESFYASEAASKILRSE
jgi:hypothetical protein